MSRPYYHPNPVRGSGGEQYEGVDFVLNEPWPEESHNVRLVGHSELNGCGDAFLIHGEALYLDWRFQPDLGRT